MRGRGSTRRLRKLPKEAEEDLLAEVQRLRTENEYIKNLQALILEDKRRQHKNAGSSGVKAKKFSRYSSLNRSTPPRNRGFSVNHKTVQRLMKELGAYLPCQNEEVSFLQRRSG